MTARLAAYTVNTPLVDELMARDPAATDSDVLAEFGGRLCYDALEKPRAATRANADYLANIVRVGHFSVLAHASASILIDQVSRALTHELIRARFLAYSQESTRYVVPDALTLEPVIPPDADAVEASDLRAAFRTALDQYDDAFSRALDRGLSRKRAAAVARGYLPHTMPTRLLCSGNMRAWRDMLAQRLPEDAEEEFRLLAAECLELLRELAPSTFADFPGPTCPGCHRELLEPGAGVCPECRP